jgi:hypothetical protein
MTGTVRPQDLLAAASSVLRQNDFDVLSETLQGADTAWLLAESELFIVAVAAALDLDELRAVEAFAASELIERLSSAEGIGGKRWDAYLVLMASQDFDPGDASRRADIEYNTRGVRRLVAVAVEPTGEDIRRVLRPFIALPAPAHDGVADAFVDLEEQLVLNGVGEDDAGRIVLAFRERGHLGDV